MEIAVLRRRAPADQAAVALDDVAERARQLAARRRPDVAAAGGRRDPPQRRLLELRDDGPAGIVAQERPRAGRLPERERRPLVLPESDAVDATVLVGERG